MFVKFCQNVADTGNFACNIFEMSQSVANCRHGYECITRTNALLQIQVCMYVALCKNLVGNFILKYTCIYYKKLLKSEKK